MKLKYRIKKYVFPFADEYFTAQYKIFGIWLYINYKQTGTIFNFSGVYCETLEEAKRRIKLHKKNINRAKDHINIKTIILKPYI